MIWRRVGRAASSQLLAAHWLPEHELQQYIDIISLPVACMKRHDLDRVIAAAAKQQRGALRVQQPHAIGVPAQPSVAFVVFLIWLRLC